jgi:fatty acid desaturase
VEVVLFWLLPTRLAVMALAFLFDYVPHRPHQVPARQDAYKATRNLGRLWLTPVLLYQNYHLSPPPVPGGALLPLQEGLVRAPPVAQP